MKTLKHAVVVNFCCNGSRETTDRQFQDHARRFVKEYVQQLQHLPLLSEKDMSASNRILFSLSTISPYNVYQLADGSLQAEVRPVVLNGWNGKVYQEISDQVDIDAVASNQRVSNDTVEKAINNVLQCFRCKEDFVVSVVSPADMPCCCDELITILQEEKRLIELILARSDTENAEAASSNILQLSRTISASGNANCSIRQVEDFMFDWRGVLKEWLYRAAPSIKSTVSTASDTKELTFEWEIRSNFMVQGTASSSASPLLVQTLNRDLSRLKLVHFVPMPSVSTSVLRGCPLHATVNKSFGTHNELVAQTIIHALQEENCGAILRCDRGAEMEFYLAVPSTQSEAILLFRIASAEEILLPFQAAALNNQPAKADAEVLDMIMRVPRVDFNPFRYESLRVLTQPPKAVSSKSSDAISFKLVSNKAARNEIVSAKKRAKIDSNSVKPKPAYSAIPTTKKRKRILL